MSEPQLTLHADAPDSALMDINGETVMLSDWWREGTTAFVFVRYLACIFCREQVKDLRDHVAAIASTGLAVVIITPARPAENAAFAEELRLPFPVLADPRRDAYRAYGLTEGSIGQLIGPRVIARSIGATLRGNLPERPHGGVARQLPGAAIVDREGRVVLHEIACDAADHITAGRLITIGRDLRIPAPQPVTL